MRSLVTGGAGFIGSNLVDALVDAGDEVVVIDDLSTGRRSNLARALEQGARLLELDIRQAGPAAEAVAGERPDRIFHLAAQIDVRRSVAEPAFDAAVNVGGTANVLEGARSLGPEPPRFVLVSTGGAIYGEGAGRELPLSESAEAIPLSPYGQSKLAAEGYVSLYERLHGIPGVSMRLGNVYGPRQDPLGEAGVIAIFCGKLRAGERPIVYGDGTQTRDYLYVGDVVTGLIAAAESDAAGAFNLGTGVQTDVLTIVEELAGLAAAQPDGSGPAHDDPARGIPEWFAPEHAAPRAGEVQAISIDPARATSELGWRPTVTLREGLRRTLDSG